jgi:hypothetical protein
LPEAASASFAFGRKIAPICRKEGGGGTFLVILFAMNDLDAFFGAFRCVFGRFSRILLREFDDSGAVFLEFSLCYFHYAPGGGNYRQMV